ncbi:hypothetical protein [Bacillus wiedmannii]|uniref:DUF2141 domain-containing protein n=1 Tax=Bacillus wiedmannii TaxID=1890302 RepID=A0ABX5DJS0_9BACI|nr:hypothetical protein [Bacillus wiedmannii]PRS99455.1 hypothetical protein C6356_29805 [Bacillus wiedmannii]PRT33802.1 hypothetical protein C6357_31345 [Bacillus wiedmannii]
MKKFAQTLLAGIVLSGGLLFGTSDAFAYESKGVYGSYKIDFRTDSNSYRGSATIVITGTAPSGGAAVELVQKGTGKVFKRQDVGSGRFRVEWPVRGIPSGLYDVHAGLQFAGQSWHGELTNYIQVN